MPRVFSSRKVICTSVRVGGVQTPRRRVGSMRPHGTRKGARVGKSQRWHRKQRLKCMAEQASSLRQEKGSVSSRSTALTGSVAQEGIQRSSLRRIQETEVARVASKEARTEMRVTWGPLKEDTNQRSWPNEGAHSECDTPDKG